MMEVGITKLLVTFDLEYCDDIVGIASIADCIEKSKASKGVSNFITTQENQPKGIIFVTGKFCRENPQLVRKLFNYGFEIGSHSNNHMEVRTQTANHFKQDTKESITIISDTIRHSISSYRAPGFTMPLSSKYYDVLHDLGIKYDYSQLIQWNSYSTKNLVNSFNHSEYSVKILPNLVWKKNEFFRPGGGNFRISSSNRILNVISRYDYQIMYLHPRDLLGFYIARNALRALSIKKFLFNACTFGNNVKKFNNLLMSDNIEIVSPNDHILHYYE